MRLIPLAGFDPDTLMPLSKRDICARAARRAKIEADMAHVAKSSEDDLPSDEQRQVIDLRELGRASLECAVACVCAAPVAVGYVLCLLTS